MEDCYQVIIDKLDYSDKLIAKNINLFFYKKIMEKKEDLIINTHTHSENTCNYIYKNYFNIYKKICAPKQHIYVCKPRSGKSTIIRSLMEHYEDFL